MSSLTFFLFAFASSISSGQREKRAPPRPARPQPAHTARNTCTHTHARDSEPGIGAPLVPSFLSSFSFPMALASLSYRDLQAELKALGVNARG